MTIGPLGVVAPPKLQFFLPGTSTPAAGAKLFTYAGNTTTKQTTYSDDNQTPNTNPIILDANGECVCFVDTTLKYAFTFAPSTDTDPPTNPYWTVPNMGFGEMIAGFAPLNSPAFTGTPTAPTPTLGDSSANIATTQFVQETVTDSFTGTPTVPTAAPGTFTTQIATTAFVGTEINRAWQMAIFSNSGTWTVPTNVKFAKFRLWGGGGGGGGGTSGGAPGSGGGGGGYAEGIISLGANTSLAIVIGTGGTAGSVNGAGGAGSATTIAALSISSSAGGGGAANGGAPGSGGSGSGLTWNFSGSTGGTTINSSAGLGGFGGTTFGSSQTPGGAVFPGGGGGGGAQGSSGNAGAAGLCIIEWMQP